MQLTSGTPILEAFSFPAMQPSQLLAFGAVPLSASMSCMSVIIPFKVILCDSGILYQASVTDPSWYKMEWFSLDVQRRMRCSKVVMQRGAQGN